MNVLFVFHQNFVVKLCAA